MFRSHYKNANDMLLPDDDLIADTKVKMVEQVSDLEFNSPKQLESKPPLKGLPLLSNYSPKQLEKYRKNLTLAFSVVSCMILVIAATMITNTFLNQTRKRAATKTVIVAKETLTTSSNYDSSLWYGNYSGNGDSSLLTISKNTTRSFKFNLSIKKEDQSEQLSGSASITSNTTAHYKGADGFVLYFTLSNGVVTIGKDPYLPDSHTISFAGDYVNIDGNVDCTSTNYFHRMRSLGSDSVYHLDLNQDGIIDTISYKSGVLSINKEVHNFTDDSANLDINTFHIVDINTRDSYINLLIMDDGASCDPVTTVVTYTSAGTIVCSTLRCNVKQLTFDNLGTISGNFRFDLLQTWYGSCNWKYEHNEVNFIEQEYYIPSDDSYQLNVKPIYSNQKLLLYKQDSLKSGHVVLKPQAVKFIKTDNIHWVEVHGLKDNTDGWLYLTHFNKVPDENLTADKLFDHLLFVDKE